MNKASERDRVSALAKIDPVKAHAAAKKIGDPWYRAQALSWIARFADGDPTPIANEARQAAAEGADAYQRTAVRAWEIAALAERGLMVEASRRIADAVAAGVRVEPISSRAEALSLILQAACSVNLATATGVYNQIVRVCPVDQHWRCKRAVRDGERLLEGKIPPRIFFT